MVFERDLHSSHPVSAASGLSSGIPSSHPDILHQPISTRDRLKLLGVGIGLPIVGIAIGRTTSGGGSQGEDGSNGGNGTSFTHDYDQSQVVTNPYAEGTPIPEVSPFDGEVTEDFFTISTQSAKLISASAQFRNTTFEYSLKTADDIHISKPQEPIRIENGVITGSTVDFNGINFAAFLLPITAVSVGDKPDSIGEKVYSYPAEIQATKIHDTIKEKGPTIALRVRMYPYIPTNEDGTQSTDAIVFIGMSPLSIDGAEIEDLSRAIDNTFRPFKRFEIDPVVQVSRKGVGVVQHDRKQQSYDPIKYQVSTTPQEIQGNLLWHAEQTHDVARRIHDAVPMESRLFGVNAQEAHTNFELVLNDLHFTNPYKTNGDWPEEPSQFIFSPTRYFFADWNDANKFSREENPGNGKALGTSAGKYGDMTVSLRYARDKVSGLDSASPTGGFLELSKEQQERARLRFTAFYNLLMTTADTPAAAEVLIPGIHDLAQNMLADPQVYAAYVSSLRGKAV